MLVGHGWTDDALTQRSLSFLLFAVDSDSVGSVVTVSQDPNILPAVTQPWTALSAHDTTLLIEAIGVAREISRAFGPSLDTELAPGRLDDLPAWVRANAGGYWHPTSTCKIGPASDPEAIGVTSSGGYSHVTGKSLAFAYVDSGFQTPGTQLAIALLGARRPATVLAGAAYDPENLRLRA